MENGTIKDGMMLPPNHAIAEYFNISDIVVRRAYSELEKENLIIRIKGKGTFLQCRPHLHFALSNHFEALGYKKLNSSLSRYITFSSLEENNGLIKVMVKKNSYPIFHQIIETSHHFFQSLKNNIDKNLVLLDAFKNNQNNNLINVSTTVRAKVASTIDSITLGIELDDPMLRFTSLIKDENSQILATIYTDFPAKYTTLEHKS